MFKENIFDYFREIFLDESKNKEISQQMPKLFKIRQNQGFYEISIQKPENRLQIEHIILFHYNFYLKNNLNHIMGKQTNILKQEDDDYRPSRSTNAQYKKKKTINQSKKSFNSSKWSLEQNKKFLNFVIMNREILECPQKRKEERVFLKLSKAIQTRTPDQCRSHHQKMIKHHNDLDGIIAELNERKINSDRNNKDSEELSVTYIEQEKIQKVQENFFIEPNLDMNIIEERVIEQDIWDVFNNQMWIDDQN